MSRVGALTLIIVLPVLAGCLAPGRTHDEPGTGGANPGLPSSLDVDLHGYVLDITMPEGQPTMIVALNVTEDMWVRPWIHDSARVEDTTSWTLCPAVKSVGLPNEYRWMPLGFWLDDQVLTPATTNWGWATTVSSDENGWRCLARLDATQRNQAIRSEEPHDGTLVLVVTLWGTPSAAPPAFRLLVGIATEACTATESGRCPPDAEATAEPLVRGGIPTFASYPEPGTCPACGFEVNDQRMTIGGLASSGTVELSRTGAVASGVTLVRALLFSNNGAQPSTLDFSTEIEGEVYSATCLSATGAGIDYVVGHASPPTLRAIFDATGTPSFYVRMADIPARVDELGWTLSSHAVAATLENAIAGPTETTCA